MEIVILHITYCAKRSRILYKEIKRSSNSTKQKYKDLRDLMMSLRIHKYDQAFTII